MSAGTAAAPVGRQLALPDARVATVRTARWIAIGAFLIYAITGGGRLTGSDEVTMFELSRSLLHGAIAVPEGATLRGSDGHFYTKNTAGQAILALPLVAAGEAVTATAHLSPARRMLAVRFVASFFNAAVTALLLAGFYFAARALGAGAGGALAATALLGFTTPLWISAKSFAAEPLEALGLLMALTGSARASAEEVAAPGASALAAVGVLLAVSAKLSMLPLALVCMAPLIGLPLRAWRLPLLALALALAGHGIYDVARFGTPFETGYGVQATPAAYTTPTLVGLYGLLLSSGKGVAWFAPALWLAPAGWRAMTRSESLRRWQTMSPAARAAWTALLAWITGLAMYCRFQHWAGDGSFGPRYLVPLLALGLLPVAFALTRPSRARRTLALVVSALGLFVQIGGVAIYFGAEMREVGDYPYKLPLDHPRFMHDSHFNPRFTPILGHWRMLLRNAGEHLHGVIPHLTGVGTSDARTGVSAEDQMRLLHALDFWWLYALYAGVPLLALLAALIVLKVAAWIALLRLRTAWRVEAHAT
jgi:hypothetical protein